MSKNEFSPPQLHDNEHQCGTTTIIQQIEPSIPTAIERPPVAVPFEVFTPKVIGHTLHFFNTISRPQIFRQIIVVPYIQKFVRYFQVPVLETYHTEQDVPF